LCLVIFVARKKQTWINTNFFQLWMLRVVRKWERRKKIFYHWVHWAHKDYIGKEIVKDCWCSDSFRKDRNRTSECKKWTWRNNKTRC
jgi:hypothetical protein